jgi:hypothetical protein
MGRSGGHERNVTQLERAGKPPKGNANATSNRIRSEPAPFGWSQAIDGESGIRWRRNFDYISTAQPSAHVLSPTWLTPLPKSSSLS